MRVWTSTCRECRDERMLIRLSPIEADLLARVLMEPPSVNPREPMLSEFAERVARELSEYLTQPAPLTRPPEP
jgi:hypothetical protein